jgi:hypothetical protein
MFSRYLSLLLTSKQVRVTSRMVVRIAGVRLYAHWRRVALAWCEEPGHASW